MIIGIILISIIIFGMLYSIISDFNNKDSEWR